jgi:hypothetical protein
MQDDRKHHAHSDDSGANKSKVQCALIDGKGYNVINEVHDFDLFIGRHA